MQDFRNLAVWRKAHALVLDVYRETEGFPRSEMYGLSTQLRRSAVSVAANIAEGGGRGGDRVFRQYLSIAMGSASETEYHLLLAHDLGLIQTDIYRVLDSSVTEVKRMLAGLIVRMRGRE